MCFPLVNRGEDIIERREVGGENMTIKETEQLILNLGPQHPSMHGLFRMVVHLEGETVRCRCYVLLW